MQPNPQDPARTPRRPEPLDATSLTGADGRVDIALGDQIYTLRITRAGKLILTK